MRVRAIPHSCVCMLPGRSLVRFLQGVKFDLVASGINRGDNCGLHVIYSGTVGAAREAACKASGFRVWGDKVYG